MPEIKHSKVNHGFKPPHEHEYYTLVTVDGHTIAGITDQTPNEAVAAFILLCEQNADDLAHLCSTAAEKREWNYKESEAGRKGKNWPEFTRKEKFIKRLLDQAGIIDS